MQSFNVVMATDEATVVAEYSPEKQNRKQYQSEAELEDALIKQLQAQGYEYLELHTPQEMVYNLRSCMQELNGYTFTDSEWDRFFKTVIANRGDGIKEKTEKIQKDYIQAFKTDDGTTINIKLIEKQNIHKNKLQVIHQYATTGNFDNRYDVSILVNGLPLVHIELKRRGIPIKEAFNQIDRYQRDSFWADAGLYEYIQIFVISNGTFTKYYSNSTRFNVVEEHNGKRKAKKTGSSSFEFTSYWADAKNKTIIDLVDFTKTFFAKHAILKILTQYCVFTSNKMLMVMRPYQIAATEAIVNQIQIAENYKLWGKIKAGGYIWHTTGSGKTLTSFKTAQIVSELSYVDKVMFVVDRQDLDYQTMREYDRFEKGAANGSKNTEKLKKNLDDDTKKIVVTTIQKLDSFIKKYDDHAIFGKKCILIFDECHRSQFGSMHLLITKKFKKYALFGFTGTPIFTVNANTASGGRISDASQAFTKKGSKFHLKTTEQTFGRKLHTYTVVHAINDKNVLPFKVDYVNTIKDNMGDDSLIEAIDDEKILLSEVRVSNVVRYILEHYNQKTMKSGQMFNYSTVTNVIDYVANFGKTNAKGEVLIEEVRKEIKRQGFNSIFAVSSIKAAKVYYEELKKQIKENPKYGGLKIATIYSYGVNEDDTSTDYLMDEDSDSTDALDVDDRAFLAHAIDEYNRMFGTQYDTSGTLFPNYYKDLSMRVKNGEIDILIVVNMFLTGFDATGLNTLWVDKNLKQHGLIQAFSRTNRILNAVKAYGNIVCFRDLRKQVDDAIALFGDDEAKGIVILKSFNDYYNGYSDTDKKGKEQHHAGYKELVEKLYAEYPLPIEIMGEEKKKQFIKLFGAILRLLNILRSFDEFAGKEIFTEADLQDYLSYYGILYDEFKVIVTKDDVSADIVFEMELVKQIVVNIDYILNLIKQYHNKHILDKEIPADIIRAISSNPELKSKKELIERFITSLNAESDVMTDWLKFKAEQKEKELVQLIADEKLKEEPARALVDKIFRIGECEPSDAAIAEILPPISRFKGGLLTETKMRVAERLKEFFVRYYD
ncbi:MAG: type I restriction endonuclease subunit R [Lachnospiraceae bacterium]|nr:type I restriction endonuclease subunit R [Lachnospiraceae bacterium]